MVIHCLDQRIPGAYCIAHVLSTRPVVSTDNTPRHTHTHLHFLPGPKTSPNHSATPEHAPNTPLGTGISRQPLLVPLKVLHISVFVYTQSRTPQTVLNQLSCKPQSFHPCLQNLQASNDGRIPQHGEEKKRKHTPCKTHNVTGKRSSQLLKLLLPLTYNTRTALLASRKLSSANRADTLVTSSELAYHINRTRVGEGWEEWRKDEDKTELGSVKTLDVWRGERPSGVGWRGGGDSRGWLADGPCIASHASSMFLARPLRSAPRLPATGMPGARQGVKVDRGGGKGGGRGSLRCGEVWAESITIPQTA